MAMVQGKSLKYRVWATHAALWVFLALIIFPLLMIVAISFREGNFAISSLIPDRPHWNTGSWHSVLRYRMLMVQSLHRHSR